jgi:adenylate cyclase
MSIAAELTCPMCGTDLRERARFCDSCGSPIMPMGESAEYKQVTSRLPTGNP